MKIPLIIFIFFIPLLLISTIINVPDDFTTIQEGIDNSVDGDTVLVQPSTYFENINFNGKAITVASLYLTTQDTTYISQTFIDGSQANTDFGSCATFTSNEDINSVLNGFSLVNGEGFYEWNYYNQRRGGGIFCNSASPHLLNLIISDNTAVGGYAGGSGGGIYCKNSTAQIETTTLINNYAAFGGGITCDSANVTIYDCTITQNEVDGGHFHSDGGGIYCINSNPMIINSTISYNSAASMGGGLYFYTSSPILTDLIVSYNSTLDGWFGGGICFQSLCNSYIENVIIKFNESIKGGGICSSGSSCDFINSIITGNYSSYKAGGIWLNNNSSSNLINTTISDNISDNYGGGMFLEYDSNAEFIDCVLWNDMPEEIYFHATHGYNSISITYSDIDGGESGIITNNNGTLNWLEGNLDDDPLFINTGDHPYSLQDLSPCIDTGNPDTLGLDLPPWDIIGNQRIWDGDGDGIAIIDMGAYEFDAPPYDEIDEDIILHTPVVHLYQNHPNPFNPATNISYQLPEKSKVNISIYNIKGQFIKTLVDEMKSAGEYSIIWNGVDQSNKNVPSGIYLYRLKTKDDSKIRKMALLK